MTRWTTLHFDIMGLVETLTGCRRSLHGCRNLLHQLRSDLSRLVGVRLMLDQPYRCQGVRSERVQVHRD